MMAPHAKKQRRNGDGSPGQPAPPPTNKAIAKAKSPQGGEDGRALGKFYNLKAVNFLLLYERNTTISISFHPTLLFLGIPVKAHWCSGNLPPLRSP